MSTFPWNSPRFRADEPDRTVIEKEEVRQLDQQLAGWSMTLGNPQLLAAVRGDIEQVHMRLDSMEHSLTSRFEHVEGELSRLRSAVYMLSKDRPEVLRLLGHNGG